MLGIVFSLAHSMRKRWIAIALAVSAMAFAGLEGCSGPTVQPVPTPQPIPTPQPLPTPQPAASAVAAPEADLSDQGCIGCHVDDARHWHASAHASAFTNEIFQAEWQPHHQAACVRCHAPLADPEAPQGEAAQNGISCAVCHVREVSVLSAHASPEAPHPITVDATLSTSESCAGCHDFTFAAVAPTPYDESEMLQGTMREWHEVEGRGTCQHCHMPEGNHAMPGARDASLLARALHVEATADVVGRQTEVTLTLTSEAGHAVPTGDMYRRLQVEAWPLTRNAAQVSTTLMRRFERRGGAMHQVSDDRVPANAPRVVTLRLPHARRIAWRITWQALDPALAEARWIPERDASRVVAEGEIEVLAR